MANARSSTKELASKFRFNMAAVQADEALGLGCNARVVARESMRRVAGFNRVPCVELKVEDPQPTPVAARRTPPDVHPADA